eukprot:TRINITY_DN1497_c0_g1_i4.p1 TRINITY_DN1497_c0_g1~~TRINITY_DN1497_c0_g1_i4.p1  ORF type:complete len:528 (+),score=71.59 TRINITY_DN1497_c0_g1_i4:123-1586(+)
MNSDVRRKLDGFFSSNLGEYLTAAIILPNIVCIILETDAKAAEAQCLEDVAPGENCDHPLKYFLSCAGYAFLALYTLEAGLRIFTYRLSILKDRWAMFDIVVVFFGYLDIIIALQGDVDLPGVAVLRVFRMARLLRMLKLFRAIPMLHCYIRGFLSAMNAMFWGFLIIMLLVVLWSVFSVEIIHPTAMIVHEEGTWCREAFSSVKLSVILLFQTLVAGDSWGQCAIPIVRRDPFAMVIFMGAFVTVQLGFTNLILAIIVEASADSRQESIEQALQARKQRRKEAEEHLGEICSLIDTDGDGLLTLEEFQVGYATNTDLRNTMDMLEVEVDDLPSLFQVMDTDRSGTLSYDELVDYVHKADTCDMQRQMVLIKLQMDKVIHAIDVYAESFKQVPPAKNPVANVCATHLPAEFDVKDVKEKQHPHGDTCTFDLAKPSTVGLREHSGDLRQDEQDLIQTEPQWHAAEAIAPFKANDMVEEASCRCPQRKI